MYKKIEMICLFCDRVFLGYKGRKFCSHTCHFSKQKADGKKGYWSGKKLSSEHRSKISLGGKGKKKPAGFALREKNGRWNPDRNAQKAKEEAIRSARMMLKSVIRRIGGKKERHTFEILGYSAIEFQAHVEKLFEEGMSWENHGRKKGGWEIDHIRPISSFSVETSLSEVNALSNIRPVWWRENASKHAKWEG